MKKWLLRVCLCALLSTPALAMAQDEPSDEPSGRGGKPKENRWIRGGNVGLWLGTYTFVQAAPFVGYRVTDRLTTGAGIDFTYIRNRNTIPVDEFSIFGGNLFGRFNVSRELFLQAEYSALSLPDAGTRIWYNSPLVGGGYFPGRGAYIMAMWALNPDYPIANPILRMGFMF
jgi:hypothetical protein